LSVASDNWNVLPLTESNLQVDVAQSRAMKQRALGALNQLPPFSMIMNRLIVSLAGEEVGFGALADLVEKDTVISGNLLHMVNSALNSRRGTINSVRHALSLLGVEKVRNVVLGMSVTRMWSHVYMPPSLSMARFNIHSSAVAILSDCLAQRVPVSYGEGAFIAGLLHDVGRLLIALSLPDKHLAIAKMHWKTGRPVYDCELEILGFSHPELSAEALTFWNLPEPIRVAVLYHHHPKADGLSTDSIAGKHQIRLSRALGVADEYVNSLAMSILSADQLVGTDDPHSGDALRLALEDRRLGEDEAELFGSLGPGSLGMDADRTRDMLAEFNAERDAMAQFFR
jgi:HD-like signal output (HDOD) protein